MAETPHASKSEKFKVPRAYIIAFFALLTVAGLTALVLLFPCKAIPPNASLQFDCKGGTEVVDVNTTWGWDSYLNRGRCHLWEVVDSPSWVVTSRQNSDGKNTQLSVRAQPFCKERERTGSICLSWGGPYLAGKEACKARIDVVQTGAKVFQCLESLRAVHIGGNWGLTVHEDRGDIDFMAFLDRIHANWVGISVALHIDSSLDSTVERIYSGVGIPTFTDDALETMIGTLKANGYHVYLTLAFDFDPSTEFPVHRSQLGDPNIPENDEEVLPENWPWRPEHDDHENFVAEFWQTYTEQAVYFANLAESLGVEMFSLGTETERLFRTRPGGENWPNDFLIYLRTMVNSVRAVYSGLLTYDMTFDGITAREFYGPGVDYLWEDLDLDIVGISAYFPLVNKEPIRVLSVDELELRWNQIYDKHLLPLKERNPSRPIVFLEFGYVNAIQSPSHPAFNEFAAWTFQDGDGNGLDDSQETQANIYQALFNINQARQNLIAGAFLWGHDWASDEAWSEVYGKMHSFAIRDKLAELTVSEHYSSLAISIP